MMNLLQQLIKKELIDKKQASSVEYDIKVSGKTEEEIILQKGLVSEDILFKLKSEGLKIPLKKVLLEEASLEILELIPHESAKYYKMIPLNKKDKDLEVGMVYPDDLRAQEALKFLSRQGNFNYKIFLISLSTFDGLLKQYKTMKKEVKIALEELETELKEEGGVAKSPIKGAEFEKMAEEAPITRVVAVILRQAVDTKSSDIHIEPTKKELRVRFRVDGVLSTNLLLPLQAHSAVVARIKILSNLKIDETRIPQDGRFSTKVSGKDIDFRVSTFPTTLGEKVVMRVLDSTEGVKEFSRLGLEKRNLDVVKKAVTKPYGLILSTGPTGSGKTTTLYAILNLLNEEGVNIITLEDPVEYFVPSINQSQIKPEIGYTFAKGLRHILRQDPDIIMVGEIRDTETATLVTHAALTGHIVLSTLHTTNALGVIPRMIDLGVAPFLIPPSLSLAIAQRLVRILCPDCKKQIMPEPKVKEMLLKEIEGLPLSAKKDVKVGQNFKIYAAQGCKKCNSEGYSGRIALFEILEMTPQLAEIIMKEPTEAKILQEAKRQEMLFMKQDGILKILAGVTSVEEVLSAAGDIND
ncbi:MAG: GspE/PulE family protein [Candidatus Nealsonbacteria bacterium]|nr:GspE/PulE family protein [Candidatus Nealsonbacteria bacterium]